jgi:hypothetical protein
MLERFIVDEYEGRDELQRGLNFNSERGYVPHSIFPDLLSQAKVERDNDWWTVIYTLGEGPLKRALDDARRELEGHLEQGA